jgi:hypothetical protein
MIIENDQLRSMRWVRYLERMGAIGSAFRILVEII